MNDLLERLFNQSLLLPEDVQWLQLAEPTELDELLERLADGLPETASLEPLCVHLARRTPGGAHASVPASPLGTAPSWHPAPAVAKLYDAMAPDNPSRGALLQILIAAGDEDSLDVAVARLNEDPPRSTTAVAQALSVFYRDPARVPAALQLIQRTWPALEHINVASPLLDLMNYACRKHALEHPATGRSAELRALLGAVVARLEQLVRERPGDDVEALQMHQAMVEEGVPLCVSLCDALALLADQPAQANLKHALALPHRRIRTEAAWALAKLGEPEGEQTLLEQVSDPYTRLRAMEYLQELELAAKIDPAYATTASRAEAALCSWLAEPTQFGLPPHELELVDRRVMYWPGYDDEQECFLFRFVYDLPQGSLVNLGLGGPVEHAFATDLTRFSLDDVYAMFAGWHAEHDEMEDAVPEQLSPAGQLEMERLLRRLKDCGYDEIEPMLFCQFFGDKALVAQAVDRRQPERGLGWAVVDAVDNLWLPGGVRFGPVEAGYVYKGRRLLHAFNEGEQ